MDPMKDDFWTQYEIKQRTLLRPFRFKEMVNQKSSLLTKLTTQPMMFNSSLGRILRRFIATADSSSPATTRTKSSNRSTVDVPSLTLLSKAEKERLLHQNSLRESRISSVKNRLSLIPRLLRKLSKTISQISEER